MGERNGGQARTRGDEVARWASVVMKRHARDDVGRWRGGHVGRHEGEELRSLRGETVYDELQPSCSFLFGCVLF